MPVVDIFGIIVRIIIGLLGLIFLPGLILSSITMNQEGVNISFSLMLGFMLQLANIYILWGLHIFYSPINFTFLIYILTTIEVIFAIVIFRKFKLFLSIDTLFNRSNADRVLVTVIILYLILAFCWQRWAPAPHSDGAAYLDMARNVVENGLFRSNMVFESNTWDYVQYSSGMQTHMFGYFAIALFFVLGNISLFSAKIMLIFTGALIIVVLYELTKKLFNINVARLAALITAVSPELLTHVGLVGGPEIPSALFSLLTVYLLIHISDQKAQVSTTVLTGVSLFIAWYAWFFNFLVMLTFLPLLFMYVATKYDKFKFMDLLLLMFFIVSLALDYRILLFSTYATIGVPISFFAIIFMAFCLLRFRKGQFSDVLTKFIIILLVAFLLLYSRYVISAFIPSMRQYASSLAPVEREISMYSRALSLEEVNRYWSMYWDGVYSYLGTVVVFLGFVALARIDKIKETALIISFPLLQAVWWCLFVTLDGAFQPRFIVCSSLFYFILVASTIEMIYLYAVKTLGMANKLRVNFKLKTWKISHSINEKNFVTAFVVGLLLLSIFNFTYPLYDKHKKIMEGWNHPQIFGWDPAIQWIKDNTQSDDILMARQGNYWAWFTERRTVFFTPSIFGSANITQLVSIIKKFNIKYLIVDYDLFQKFSELRMLYSSASSFYGSKIVFSSINEQGYKTIIYNVTNISYGNLVRLETTISNCDSNQYWSIFALYGNGTVTTDDLDKVEGNSSIKITSTVKEQKDLTPSAVIMYDLAQPLDLSNTSNLQFWIKAPFNYQDIHIKLATDSNNYIFIHTQGTQSQTWEQITIPLTNVVSTLGEPNLQSISFIQIYIRGLEPNTTYTYWLDNISAYDEQYVLDGQK